MSCRISNLHNVCKCCISNLHNVCKCGISNLHMVGKSMSFIVCVNHSYTRNKSVTWLLSKYLFENYFGSFFLKYERIRQQLLLIHVNYVQTCYI